MMNRMIVSNLVHRPFRSIISIVAVAVEVTLILLIVGLAVGILSDSKERQAGIGADVVVQPPGSSFFSGITGAPVSIKVADKLRQLPHVAAVSPVITQLSTAGALEVIYGVDLKSFEEMGGPFHYLQGGPFTAADDIIVDDFFAASSHVRVGSTVTVLNHPFKVCGVVEHGKGGRKFLPITTLQDLIGASGKASVFYVKLDNPANAPAVIAEIKDVPGMNTYVVRTVADIISQLTPSQVPGLSIFIDIVIGVAVVIGFIVIFQAMYAAVMERTREIGILKSMGASKLYIVNVVLRETIVLAVLGIALGVVVSYTARALLVERFRTVRILVTLGWVGRATLIAILGSVFGAIYPAFKAAQKDPIDALAYE